MAISPPITHRQAAEIMGVSLRTVGNWVKNGEGPPQNPKGTFPPKEFGEWYRARFKAELGLKDDGKVYDFNVERARLVKAQADKAELEAAELARELVRAEDVKLTWGELVAAVRAKLLSLPSKLAPQVAPPGKVAEAQALAEAMVFEALSELAGSGLPTNRAGTGGSGAVDAGAAPEADSQPVGGSAPEAVGRVKRRAGKVEH